MSVLQNVRWPTFACAAVLVVHVALLGWSAAANSSTYDEPVHLAAGVAYWQRGDFSIYCHSPPLLRLWAALPAVLAGAVAPNTAAADQRPIVRRHLYYANHFFYDNFGRFPWFLLIGRWGMIPVSCFAGWISCRWAEALFGKVSG